MITAVSAQLSPRLAALREKMQGSRSRLIFALDATASREETWDLAASLQNQMFEEAAKIGGLDVQLVYYRGHDEVKASAWLPDAHKLVQRMGTIKCQAGPLRSGGYCGTSEQRTRVDSRRGGVYRRRGRGVTARFVRRTRSDCPALLLSRRAWAGDLRRPARRIGAATSGQSVESIFPRWRRGAAVLTGDSTLARRGT